MTNDKKHRCEWSTINAHEIAYHDAEWGRPLHDDRALFELLLLEGMQAGLSWDTVLSKRDHFRQAFDHFDPQIIANYDQNKLNELLSNQNIIRNRLKIAASVTNARAFLRVQEEFDSFDCYLWAFVDYIPIVNDIRSKEDIPVSTPLSERLSKDLKKRGFTFVGPVIIYAFMQACGMVDDHENTCFCKTRPPKC